MRVFPKKRRGVSRGPQSYQPGPACQRATVVAFAALLLGACGPAHDSNISRVRVASLSAPGSPWHDEWLRFQQRVEARQDPGIELDMFIAGQLGSEETVLSNLRRGRVQIGGFSLHGLATVVPELSVLLAPYLFESRAEVDFVMDNYLTDIFNELFDAQGLTLLRWSEVGWNHIFCREPVLTPDDIQDVKIRASSAIGPQVFARRVGADNVPVAYAELITALQTGLLDCGQGGIGLYALTGIGREAPQLTLTYHIFDTGLIVANRGWLNGLPADRRMIILGGIESADDSRRLLRAALRSIQDERLADLGVVLHELTAEQQAAWRAAAIGSHEEVIEITGGRAREVYDLIVAGKRAFKAAAATDATQ
ncbi:MAG: TRAP transporter substrate-binding protein DctP [Gammaproteobacteria bacterium]|nr:TRAP transporter substrate-binding protein DctP [Gammaproteobacteria bacterium]